MAKESSNLIGKDNILVNHLKIYIIHDKKKLFSLESS